MSESFISEIRIFAGNYAPRGWAFCDGRLLSLAQNTALFSLLGTTYGGDGRTNFALPNLQGSAPMQAGNGPGLTPRSLGETGGTPSVQLTLGQMAAHTHRQFGSIDVPDSKQPGGSVAAKPAGRGATVLYGTTNPVAMDTRAVSSYGQGQAHDNMQPYLVLSFIIALVGTYPVRS
jgi:microcystin-dependent protein